MGVNGRKEKTKKHINRLSIVICLLAVLFSIAAIFFILQKSSRLQQSETQKLQTVTDQWIEKNVTEIALLNRTFAYLGYTAAMVDRHNNVIVYREQEKASNFENGLVPYQALEIPEPEGRKVSVSVGVTFYDGIDETTFDMLYRNADRAAYESKRMLGNRYTFFDHMTK